MIGDGQFENRYHRKLELHLSNPQGLNSYSYAVNNPVKIIDENGEIIPLIIAIALFAGGTFFLNDIAVARAPINVDNLSQRYESKAAIEHYSSTYDNLPGIAKFGVGIFFGGIKDDASRLARQLSPTRYNYRDLYQRAYGKLEQGLQIHHILPQKYESLFGNAGINIHDLKYLEAVPEKIHRQISEAWRNWDKAQGSNVTIDKVKDFTSQVQERFGKYYKDKIE